MFTSYPTYSRYRTLQLTTPQQRGEDVYALQVALNKRGFDCGDADGILGPNTSRAILEFQKEAYLTADGKAGGITQQALTMELVSEVAPLLDIPVTCFRGQLELESGFRLGNYSPMRPDGSYDAGVAQRNTQFTKASVGFDPVLSIRALGEVVRNHHSLFSGVASRRRWALAQGAWNAPAFACYLARAEGATRVTSSMVLKPTEAQRQIFETYVANASAYLAI